MAECQSVVVPVYNDEATLVAVMHRLQTVPHLLETVIVDDCSHNSAGDTVKLRFGVVLHFVAGFLVTSVGANNSSRLTHA